MEHNHGKKDAPDVQDDLDRWLDLSLSEYGQEEPRVGLEKRILANLGAERARLSMWRRWLWASGAIFAAGIVAVWFGGLPAAPRAENPLPANIPMVVARQPSQAAAKIPSQRHARERVASPETLLAVAGKVVGQPKLDQFPSSQPLSEQGRLLLEYLKTTPKEEIIAAARPKDVNDLQIKRLEIPPLAP